MNESFEMEFTLDKVVYSKETFIIARVFSKTNEVKQYLNPIYQNISIKGNMVSLKGGIVYKAIVEKVEKNQYGYTLSVANVYARDFQADGINTDSMMYSFISAFVGEGTAEKIKNVKGICKIIKENDKESLMRIKGIGEATANKIIQTYQKDAVGSKYIIQLKEIGVTDNEILRLKNIFDDDLLLAYESIKKNVYNVNCIRFDRADNIFLNYLNGNPSDKRRVKAYIKRALKEYLFEDYRSYVTIEEFYHSPIITNIVTNTSKEVYEKCLRELIKEDEIKIIEDKYVTTSSIYNYDVKLYNELNRLIGKDNKHSGADIIDIDRLIKEEEEKFNVELNEGQKNAIKQILLHNVSLMTGGGGVGKSFSTKILLNIIERIQGVEFCSTLCTLSGKASKVLADSTDREARTIHSTIACSDEGDKFNTSVLVLDEVSMIPNDLMYKILSLIDSGAYVVFIGDENQLLPIGFANVIHDLNKLPNLCKVELTQPMRQAMKSGILNTCTSIRHGKNPFNRGQYNIYGELNDMEVIIGSNNYEEMINRYVKAFDVNNKLDYVILGCTRKLTSKINLDIQRGLIESGKLKEDEDFIEVFTELKDEKGKKVRMKLYKGDVCLIIKNSYNLLSVEDYELNIQRGNKTLFNGNTVIIEDIYTDACLVRSEDDELFVIRVENYEIITPGYSYSIHKSQGSTIKYCFIYLENNYVTKNMLLVQEALYTAISRAKLYCGMYVEDYSVLSKSINNKEINNRQTVLELILDGVINS